MLKRLINANIFKQHDMSRDVALWRSSHCGRVQSCVEALQDLDSLLCSYMPCTLLIALLPIHLNHENIEVQGLLYIFFWFACLTTQQQSLPDHVLVSCSLGPVKPTATPAYYVLTELVLHMNEYILVMHRSLKCADCRSRSRDSRMNVHTTRPHYTQPLRQFVLVLHFKTIPL